MSIQFPNLGINLDYVGESIRIFGFEITFFGLLIAAEKCCWDWDL